MNKLLIKLTSSTAYFLGPRHIMRKRTGMGGGGGGWGDYSMTKVERVGEIWNHT